MKKHLLSISLIATLALVITACNSNPRSTQPPVTSDTTGLAQFNEWKAMEAQAVPAKNNKVAYAAKPKAAPAVNYSNKSETTNEAKVVKKKGWSKAAKYAVIGTAGGGVLGAVINKRDSVKGAGIGAGVLGGGGYVLCRSQDKKDGRF